MRRSSELTFCGPDFREKPFPQPRPSPPEAHRTPLFTPRQSRQSCWWQQHSPLLQARRRGLGVMPARPKLS